MPETYVAGGVDPISRLRELISDTALSIVDARLQRWLDDTRSVETLRIYLPTGTDGATAATVSVAMDTGVLTLALARTMSPAEDPDELALAPGDAATRVRNIIDWVGSLDKGWRVGISIGDDIDWCDPTSTSWLGQLVTTGSLAVHAPSINLALTEDPLTAYGAEEDAAELHFYQFGRAAQMAVALQDVNTVSQRREGNVSRTYRGVTDALGSLITIHARNGIYATP